MRRYDLFCLIVAILFAGCAPATTPAPPVLGPDAPYPPTWTPTSAPVDTPTFTLVVKPTPTWDGTPPPPSTAEVPRVSTARLYQEVESGSVIVVDVRNFAAYTQAHIPDALHIPLEELPHRVGDLDGNQTIVLYDLSPNDTLGLNGAMYLYEVGFTQIAVLDGGLQKWYSDGYPIEGTLLTPTPGPFGPPWAVTPLITTTLQATGTVAPATSTPATSASQTMTPSPTLSAATPAVAPTPAITPTLTQAP
jgi:rhodanese-related sulfurtransferase